jgi:hypothetical protein
VDVRTVVADKATTRGVVVTKTSAPMAAVRVARFFFVHDTKTEKNVPNEHKMHQMVMSAQVHIIN